MDLLLGTDLHSKLGFQFLKTKSDGTAVDLLQGEKWTVEQPLPVDTSPSSPPELLFEADQEATVCLLQPVKVPARHTRFVRAHAVNAPSGKDGLFESRDTLVAEKELIIDDTATCPDQDGNVVLAIQNHSLMPVHLEEGLVLGELHQLDIVPGDRAKKLSVELMLDEVRAVHPVPHQTLDDKPSTLRPTLMSKEHGD